MCSSSAFIEEIKGLSESMARSEEAKVVYQLKSRFKWCPP